MSLSESLSLISTTVFESAFRGLVAGVVAVGVFVTVVGGADFADESAGVVDDLL